MKPALPACLVAACLAVLSSRAPAAELEGVGRDMGYRVFGEAKKNKPVLLQNSRQQPIQYFDEQRGLFVTVPAFSDVDVPCRGKARKLNVRYRDAFREEAPFQLVIACGREVQFLAPQQIAPPRPVELPSNGIVIEPLVPAADGGATRGQ